MGDEDPPGGFGPRFAELADPAGNSGRPVAAPLPAVAELLDLPLEQVEQAAAAVVPYAHADGSPRWSLMLVEKALENAGGWERPRRRPPPPIIHGRAGRAGRAAAT